MHIHGNMDKLYWAAGRLLGGQFLGSVCFLRPQSFDISTKHLAAEEEVVMKHRVRVSLINTRFFQVSKIPLLYLNVHWYARQYQDIYNNMHVMMMF